MVSCTAGAVGGKPGTQLSAPARVVCETLRSSERRSFANRQDRQRAVSAGGPRTHRARRAHHRPRFRAKSLSLLRAAGAEREPLGDAPNRRPALSLSMQRFTGWDPDSPTRKIVRRAQRSGARQAIARLRGRADWREDPLRLQLEPRQRAHPRRTAGRPQIAPLVSARAP